MGLRPPRLLAQGLGHYLHNLTTILADQSSNFTPRKLDYNILDKPTTVHDLLIQKSDGTLELAVWGERAKGSDDVTVKFGCRAGVGESVRSDARRRARPDPSSTSARCR